MCIRDRIITQSGKMKLWGFCVRSVRQTGTQLEPELFRGCAAVEQYSAVSYTHLDVYKRQKSMRKASFTIFTISQNICSCKEVFSFYFLKLLPKRINLPRRKLLGKALLYQNQGFQVGSDLVQHCSGLKFLTGLGKRSGLIKFSHFR